MSPNKRFLMQLIEDKRWEEHSFDNPLLMMEKFQTEQKGKAMFERVILAKRIRQTSFWKEFFVAIYWNSDSGEKELLLEYEENYGRKPELRLYNIPLLSEISREIAASSGYGLKPLF